LGATRMGDSTHFLDSEDIRVTDMPVTRPGTSHARTQVGPGPSWPCPAERNGCTPPHAKRHRMLS
jgi:hypothetical protein